MTSFDRLVSSPDPGHYTETYNYMRGLDSDGGLVIDPTTGVPTYYVVSGDPVGETGWLDSIPSDRRFMLNSGPFTMVPGDTQQVVIGIVIGQSQNSGVAQANPGSISLSAYPNPVRHEMSFSYILPVGEAVRLSIYTPTGQAIRTLIGARYDDGTQGQAVWNLRDDSGAEVAPGIYFIRMDAGSYRATKKVVLLR
jgi:hypothetical protein